MKYSAGFLALLLMARCGTTFSELRGVTRIEVTDNLSKPLAKIEDAEQVRRIMEFVNARKSGWDVPWYGVPVPTLVANFYRGREFLGHFGAGTNFFECQREGGFYSQRANDAELAEFEKLVGARRRLVR